MGETAPPQAPAGSLAIGVSNVGLIGGGTVAPRLHSAIVERLRARIAVCRQHHLNCEGRYERSRAESSDRERENTLQLLTLVQHGQGSRKSSKHSKNSCAAPPDYRHHQPQQPQLLGDEGNDVNGGQQTSNGLGQRNSALIALQGSLKRRLVVNVSPTNSKRSNGVTDNAFLNFKKIKSNECVPIGQNMYHAVDGASQSIGGSMPMDQAIHRKNGNIASNDMFNTTLKDIKKEPGENLPCSNHFDSHLSHENIFRYGDDNGDQLMDPELQELFNEFTYISVPPMSDIELQNMINITIKQDEPFNIDIGQQNQSTSSSLPMDKVVIKSEYSQCLNPTRVGSPQMRPSSTGPTFSMSTSPLASSPSTTVAQNQAQSQVSNCVNRMNNWQELSHAQQLKQMAANRQHNLIQQHQPSASSNWSNVSSTGQTSRQYGLEKVPSPFRQQQLSPHGTSVSTPPGSGNQQKAISNYLYKSSSPNNPGEMMKPQDTNKNSMTSSHLPADHHLGMPKPLFHYSSDQPNQQVPSMLGTQPKPGMQFSPQQPQSSTTAQHEAAPQVNTVSNQSLPRPSNFQQKMMPKIPNQPMPGLQYPPVHQQQEQQCNTTNLGTSSSTASCSSPNGYNTQQALLNQQMMEKTGIIQRQMQQQMLPGTEKCNNQDQLNRHLTRPPPDYKDQRRGTVGIQQANQFTSGLPTVGVTPDPTIPNSPSANMTPQNPSHTSTNHGSRMQTLQGSPNMYGNVSCPQQSMYSGMSQTSSNQMGTSQNGSVVSRQPTVTPGTNMSPFGTQSGNNGPPFRSNGPNTAGQRPQNVINNSPPTQKWMSSEVKRQDIVGYANQYSNQSVQGMISHQPFPQRALSMPNQVNSGVQMTPLSTMSPSNNGQTIEPLRGFNHGQSPLRSQMLPSMSQAGTGMTVQPNTFNSTNQISRAFPRSDSTNDLGSFDFLSQNGGLGSSPNGDSDFIDALLKTGHINDDWMKDINLDEIFKGHS